MNPTDALPRIPGTALPMVELLPLRAEHAEAVHGWFCDERARPWLDLGGGRQWLPKRELFLLLTGARSHTRLVRLPGCPEPLGLVCLNDVTNEMGSADVWGVRGTFAGGPANVSVASFLLMLAHGFLDLQREVIGSWIVDGNHFSIAMHQRLGLKETGRQRGRHCSGGQRRDRLLYDITRDEFAARFPHVPSESRRTFAGERSKAPAPAAADAEAAHV